jgi:nicotinamide riboside transporter PnuC
VDIEFWQWVPVPVVVVALLGLIHKKRWCFILFLIVNALWSILAWNDDKPGLVALQLVYVPLNVWGYVKWSKDESR